MKTLFKTLLTAASIMITANLSYSQVGIGTKTPDASAILDVSSIAKGFLPPRMTETQRDAITATNGLLIYNTDSDNLNYNDGSSWQVVTVADSVVNTSTGQTIAGNKTFTGMLTADGRLMLPMGELSYFDYTVGFSVSLPNQSTGGDDTDGMMRVDPTALGTNHSEITFVNDNFGTGDSTRLRYQGTVGRYFHIALSFSYTPGTTGAKLVFGVALNGTVQNSSKVFMKAGNTSDSQSSAIHVLLWLDPNDYIEFYAGQTRFTSSSITMKTFNFVAIGL